MNPRSSDTRILSLDVFRGLTITMMVLVNSLGPQSYPILMHAQWDGFTLADLVFPAFLFIVGITTVVSLKKHVLAESKKQVYRGILKRTLLLLFLGILLNVFPTHFDLNTLRFYGVLQRIAICYFIGAMLYLHTSFRTQCVIFIFILVGYWYLLTQVPIPIPGIEQLTLARNWAAYVDGMIFAPAHLLLKTFDPEGFLSTIPAIATTLSGLLTGHLLTTQISKCKKTLLLMAAGLFSLLLAWLWSSYFPINKNLWTSTYVLWSSGFSLIIFGFCFWINDVLAYTRWSLPFKIFGMNALFIFIFHVVLIKTIRVITFTTADGSPQKLCDRITEYLFGSFSPQNASLFYSLLFLLFNFLVAAFLYRRKIFIKI